MQARMTVMALAGLAWLAACAAPTPYGPIQNGYGYVEAPVGENAYRVAFFGNPATPRETVEDYLMLRAAELTLERGFEQFRVREARTELVNTRRSVEPTNCLSPYYYTNFPVYADEGPEHYEAFAFIELGPGEADDAPAHDAQEVVAALGDCPRR